MKRRQALKNIGLGAGILVMGPSALSLLQSCKNEPEYDWKPTFLSASHGFALKRVLDVIIPKTDTPGASDLNIAQFIDSYMNEVADENNQERFTEASERFAESFNRDFDKAHEEGTDEDFDTIIKKYLKATPAEREQYMKRNTETQDAQEQKEEGDFEENTTPAMGKDEGAYNYLTSVRDMAIWAWKNSEEIGENVMWYDPIPGEYIPCGPITELGGGKAMSL